MVYPFDGFQLFAINGYGVKVVDITLLLLYIVFFYYLIKNQKRAIISRNIVIQFSLIILISTLLSGFHPIIKGEGAAIIQFFKTISHFIFVYFFIFFCIFYEFKDNFWDKLIRVLLIYSIFVNIFGIYQVFARLYDLPLAWLPINNVSMAYRGVYDISDISQISIQFINLYRATSIFTEPSHYAVFLTTILVFLLTPIIQKHEPFIKNKVLNIIIFSLSFVALLATFSLTALLSVFIIVLGYLIFEFNNFFKKSILISISLLIVLILSDYVIKYFTETSPLELFYKRVEGVIGTISGTDKQISGESFKYRTTIIQTSFEIWEKSPIIGCGLGNFYLNQNKDINFAHDILTNALAEMGIVGAFAVLVFFISTFIVLLKLKHNLSMLKINNEDKRLLGVAFFLLLQIFSVNFFSSSFFVYANFWFFFGLIVFIINKIYTQNISEKNLIISFSNNTIESLFRFFNNRRL